MNTEFVFDTTSEAFENDVLVRSASQPVVVDFWAPWCQPCLALKPELEKAVLALEGKLALAKVNVDENQPLAQYFSVQSIPAVFAIHNTQVVDGFVGLKMGSQLTQWLMGLIPSPADELLRQALALRESDPAASESMLKEVLLLSPDHEAAAVALGELLLAAGRLEEVEEWLARLEARGYLGAAAEALQAKLALRQAGDHAGGVAACKAAMERDPKNPQLQLQLADALAAANQTEDALQLLLECVQIQPGDARLQAKERLLNLLKSLPTDSDLVHEYRRKLSTALA